VGKNKNIDKTPIIMPLSKEKCNENTIIAYHTLTLRPPDIFPLKKSVQMFIHIAQFQLNFIMILEVS